jgi:hypothetical protein
MILSIDVGTVNLAMCLIDLETKRIHNWDVDGIPSQHADGIYVTLRKHLDARPWVLTATTILIERQPDRSKKMVSVQSFLEAYFVIRCPESKTILYDARHKVPDVVGAGKAMYRLRKNTAIQRCEEFITNGPEINRDWVDFFKKCKKKDDLSDTVMQALSYEMPRRVIEPKKKASSDRAPVARKPTENQARTKYSKSNLIWLVKNKTDAELKIDKKFQRDLKKHFHSMDEIKNIIKK